MKSIIHFALCDKCLCGSSSKRKTNCFSHLVTCKKCIERQKKVLIAHEWLESVLCGSTQLHMNVKEFDAIVYKIAGVTK